MLRHRKLCHFDKSAGKYANISSMGSDVQPIINHVSVAYASCEYLGLSRAGLNKLSRYKNIP